MSLAAVATIATAALLFALLTIAANLGEATFPGLGGHFFSGVRALLGIGLCVGALALWWVPPPVTTLQCEVEDTFLDFGKLDSGDHPMRVRLRWRSSDDGAWYRTKKPLGIPHTFDRGDIMEQYREGGFVPCYYPDGHPQDIRTGTYERGLTIPRLIAMCMVLYGLFFAFMGGRRWLRTLHHKRSPPWRHNVSVALTYALITWLVLGILMSVYPSTKFVGYALVLLSFGGISYFFGRETAIQQRALERLSKQMKDLEPWPAMLAATHLSEFDDADYEGQIGTWKGCSVRFAVGAHRAVLQIELPDWPKRLRIEARADTDAASAGQDAPAPTGPTGDPEFDAALDIRAEPLLWRPRLSRSIRRRLITCLVDLDGVIEPEHKVLTFRVTARQFERVDFYVNNGVELSQAISAHHSEADRKQWLFEQLPAEPNAAVRLGHYRWLHAQGWNTALLSRAAAADRDEQIREWASGQLPPTEGVFR